MIEKYIDNRLFILYLFPFILGALTVVSFQPFNFSFVNFIILPLFFYLVVYIKKNLKVFIEKNLLKKIYLYLVLFLVSLIILPGFTGLLIH